MNIALDFDGFMTLMYFVLFRHADFLWSLYKPIVAEFSPRAPSIIFFHQSFISAETRNGGDGRCSERMIVRSTCLMFR
jgi:hypothetical protein